MRLSHMKPRRVRTINPDGSFGGMVMELSADDRIAIFSNYAFALQVRHPDGRCVRIDWDGEVSVGVGLVEVENPAASE